MQENTIENRDAFYEWLFEAGHGTRISDIQLALEDAWNAGRNFEKSAGLKEESELESKNG